MKIYMVGNFTAPWCSEVHWAKCLEKLGHQVTRKQENSLSAGVIAREARGHDMFLWVRTWDGFVTQADLDAIRAMGIPSVNMHLDLFIGISREATLDTDPRWRTDFVFTADGDPKSQEVFEAHGINHYWLRAGVYDDGCVMFEPNHDPTLQGGVVFVGGGKEYAHKEWPYRKQLIEFLETGYPTEYRKYGHPQKLVRENDLNQLYANAKIVIGDSLNVGFNHPNYWSDRVYETTGRGGFIIHPRIAGLEKDFVEDKEIVFYDYNNWAELASKIDYYLEHEDERKAIQKAGFERTKRDHTYTKRLQEMLDIVFDTAHATQPVRHSTNAVRPDEVVLDAMIQKFTPPFQVNLGAGTDIQPEWINVDMVDLPGIDIVHNLMHYPWPFDDNTVSHIRAIDVLEHMPPYIGEQHGVIKFIEECHRILQPGGELFIQTPGWRAEFLWIDPTHVRGFDVQTMDFFDPTTHYGTTTGFYSKCKFKVKAEELPNHNLRFWMEKM